jgi:hypothetical protein
LDGVGEQGGAAGFDPPLVNDQRQVGDEVLMTRNDNDDNDDSNNFEAKGANDKMIAFYNLL